MRPVDQEGIKGRISEDRYHAFFNSLLNFGNSGQGIHISDIFKLKEALEVFLSRT